MTVPGHASGHDAPLRVAYILKMFPRLSETFILNELLALERAGVEVNVFSLMLPDDGRFHGRLSKLRTTVCNVPRDKPELLWQQIHEFDPELVPPLGSWEQAVSFLRRHGIPRDLELLLRSVLIAAEMRIRRVEHIHAHFATIATRVAALVHLLTGIPFSFTSHAKDIFRETVNRSLYAELVDLAAFNVTVCDFNREFLITHTPGVDASKIQRIYNGIDLGFFKPAQCDPTQRDPTQRDPTQCDPPPPTRIVSVGRLVPKKGFSVLLRALRLWKDQGRRFEATIIGDGEQREELLELRRTLDLSSEVTFTGALPHEQVREICSTATMNVLACVTDEIGNQDALPTTLLESLALGVPVVSTRIAGVPEIVGDVGGVVTEPGDAAAIARAMDELLRRVESGEVRREALRDRAETLFDLHRNVDELRRRFHVSARGRPQP